MEQHAPSSYLKKWKYPKRTADYRDTNPIRLRIWGRNMELHLLSAVMYTSQQKVEKMEQLKLRGGELELIRG